ncbi:MAG: ACP S-malonyltransferase [Clostridia bacterium]|nr:ACP S-malonyltransferase [Clostridia bacterium]
MGKTALLFSGQGSQYVGMAKDFHDSLSSSKEIFDEAERILGRSIADVCFNGEDEELDLTHNTQPCMLTCEIAMFEAFREAGISFDAVAGFSLGEYSALVAAGGISFEDAIRIVQIRADSMQNAVPVGEGGMVVLESSDREYIESLCSKCDGYVEPANWNCPNQTVVSGEAAAVKQFRKLAKADGVRALPLRTSAPFHCKMMEPVTDVLKKEFDNTEIHDTEVPVYMNIDAQAERDSKLIKDKIVRQAMSPVMWEQTIRNLHNDGVDTFIEIGPGQVLMKHVNKTLKDEAEYVSCCVEKIQDLDDLKEIMKGRE